MNTHPLIKRLERDLQGLPQGSEKYKEARRKVRNEKQNLKRALKQQIRDEWTAEQAVDDIERQLQGIRFAKQAAVDTSCRPQQPAQKRLVEALTAPLSDTLEGQFRRRDNAINAVSGGDGNGGCISDEPFIDYRASVSTDGNGVSDCITRNFATDSFKTCAAQSNIDTCFAATTYEAVWDCYSGSLHSAGHQGIGGKMGNVVASPTDPLFFLHHANLDRLWWDWQLVNLSSRLTGVFIQIPT